MSTALLQNTSKYWKTKRNDKSPKIYIGLNYWFTVLASTLLIAGTSYIGHEQLSGSFISCVNNIRQQEDHCRTISHWYKPVPPLHPMHNKPFVSYFRWIPLIFLTQAVLFLFCKSLWGFMEGGLIRNATRAVREGGIIEKSMRAPMAVDLNTYLKESQVVRLYAAKFCLAYFIFWMVLAGNLYFMAFVMDANMEENNPYDFPAIASKWNTVYQDRNDSLANVFPVKISCRFEMFGPSGMPQNIDILCSIPQNGKTEYLFMAAFWMLNLLGMLSVLDFCICLISVTSFTATAGRNGRECKGLESLPLTRRLSYFILRKNVDEQMWYECMDDLNMTMM